MTDYSRLVNALREESTFQGCNGDDVSTRLYDMLDRIASDLAVPERNPKPLADKLRDAERQIDEDPPDMTTALVPIELLGQVADLLAGRGVIADVLRAADGWSDNGFSLLSLRDKIETWREAGRPGLGA